MLRKYREEKQDGFNQQLFKVKYILKKVKYIWTDIVFFIIYAPDSQFLSIEKVTQLVILVL